MVEMKASSGADPQLYRPRPPLADCIEYFGYWQRDSGDAHQSRALPRGAATIIVDVAGRQRVDFYASDGSSRLDVPPAFIAGAGTASYVTHMTAAVRAEVGLAPKAYQRVRRLQAALRQLDSAPAGGATIAADLGYFDHAHFVREFRSFTAMTPTQYAQRRSWLPSHVELPPHAPRAGRPKYPSQQSLRHT